MGNLILGAVSAVIGLVSIISFLVFVHELPNDKGNSPTVFIVGIALLWLLYLGWSMCTGSPN